ncbi:adenosine deaminase [Powellomyces hirtus]|uniref:adenosine deaminase n=1 Tax=Powellomyces hirtus TaxID=109895 RepID=A0A507E908_9FUNG|nr:adenosine deaminase [Powellomyces hirtus]
MSPDSKMHESMASQSQVPRQNPYSQSLIVGGLLTLFIAALASLSVVTPLAVSSSASNLDYESSFKSREEWLNLDNATRFDRDIRLTPLELKTNAYLMKLRLEEGEALAKTSLFPPTLRFPVAKPIIEKTKLFEAIRTMPKGGYLHAHLEALADIQWMIRSAVAYPTCHIKFDPVKYRTYSVNDTGSVLLARFQFTSASLSSRDWVQCNVARNAYPGGPTAFDTHLELTNTLIPDVYPTEDIAWARFMLTFAMLGDLIRYQPMFEQYITRFLHTSLDDGITYAEIRISKWDNYDEASQVVPFRAVLDSVRRLVTAFKVSHPDFQDLKFVYQDVRFNTHANIAASLKDAIALRQSHASQIVGFDLVGHEVTAPLTNLVTLLKNGKRAAAQAGVDLPFMLHAGETLRSGVAPDTNLVDALLLGSKRLGHAFSLAHHQGLIEKVRDMDVAVEVAVISNQMLGLVTDIRQHPVIDLLLRGVQVALASDDPSVFGYEGVSFDFYQVYMSFESLDIASLKKLSMNGITYSGMTKKERAHAMRIFNKRWDAWIAVFAAQG